MHQGLGQLSRPPRDGSPPVSPLRPGRPRSRTRGSPQRRPPPSTNGGRAGTGAAGAGRADWLPPAPPQPGRCLEPGHPLAGTGRDRAGRDGRDAGGTVSAARGRAGGGAQRLGARLFRHV